ncbi:N-acetyltransferase 8-like [Homarus americanus]|uniref:N-acetyltransferase 8-like n=1 Tax=Homarus americanus TaxID=6706 RepID=A0A8J5K3R9_HOMAM|nr:N-acetyltransferase 8-like [Homarus americanus]
MREEFPPVCVIRPYRKGDEVTIQEIMTEATMETVGEFFWAAVMSEVFPQVALLAIAVSFIGLGIPFYFCLFGIPVAIIIIYVAMELHEDLNNITRIYMQYPDTGFWVAEVLEVSEANELNMLMNKTKKVEYEFLTEAQLEAKDIDLEGQRRHIVGTVAITKSLRGGSKAWLRRMAVKKMYRRRGIAMGLLDEVIQFCTDRCYEEIELITTECHYKARELYYKRGFEARHTYFKYYLNVQQPMYLFSLPLKPPEAELSEISAS